jgi:hypothetical protein
LLLKLFLIIRSLTHAPAEEPDRGAVDRPQNAQAVLRLARKTVVAVLEDTQPFLISWRNVSRLVTHLLRVTNVTHGRVP